MYQILVAMDLAISVVTDPKYDWIEIDATSLGKDNKPLAIDDVVVGNGTQVLVCCQAKKNEREHGTWSTADLADELKKAFSLFLSKTTKEIRFYSRSPFGELASLREHAHVHATLDAYLSASSASHKATHEKLSKLCTDSTSDQIYRFIQTLALNVTDDFHQLEQKLKERLNLIASNSLNAYQALYCSLDELSKRAAVAPNEQLPLSKFTKKHLREIIHNAGAVLSPPVNALELRKQLGQVSAIGRAWRRDVGGERIPLPASDLLKVAASSGARRILLTGIPGGGKTCVLLDFVEQTEVQTDNTVVFIQAREYASLASADDRAAHGFPRELCSLVGRMADINHVTVVIDSLDVLSISRETTALSYFLGLIDQLVLIDNVTVVAACREFDIKYDSRLANVAWDETVRCDELDWLVHVEPLLARRKIDLEKIGEATRKVICNPLDLGLFVEVVEKIGAINASTRQLLADRYLEALVVKNTEIGDAGLRILERIAARMVATRELAVIRADIVAEEPLLRNLCSAGVLEVTENGLLRFRHQTLLDSLVVGDAMRNHRSLKELIDNLAPVPFVRPLIRCYVAVIAAKSQLELRRQVRAIVSGNVAYHVKRLIVECLLDQVPGDDDWPLIRWLFDDHRDLFNALFFKLDSFAWYSFMSKHYRPYFVQKQDVQALGSYSRWIAKWKEQAPDAVFRFWIDALQMSWAKGAQVEWTVSVELPKTRCAEPALLAKIVELLIKNRSHDRDLLGQVIAYGVKQGAVSDEALWGYVTANITTDDLSRYGFRGKLNCESHDFGNDQHFFENRICASDFLLSLAIADIERWSEKCRWTKRETQWCDVFTDDTSHYRHHSKHDMYHVTPIGELFRVIEVAIDSHAAKESQWWKLNAVRLTSSREGALRYLALRAITQHIENNVVHTARILLDRYMPFSSLSFEFAELCRKVFPFVDYSIQESIERKLVRRWRACQLPERMGNAQHCASLARAIPCHLRSSELTILLACWERKFGLVVNEPEIRSSGGMVHPPFSHEVFLRVSDDAVLRLLAHYRSNEWSTFEQDHLVGGAEQVERVLNDASSRDPTRFLAFLRKHWTDIPDRYREEILGGVANHLSYLYGRVGQQQGWEPIAKPDPVTLARLMLDEVERHPLDWSGKREAAKAANACAHVVNTDADIHRVLFVALGFSGVKEAYDREREQQKDLIFIGINMARGEAAQAALTLLRRMIEDETPWPELLLPSIKKFAMDSNSAIRALVLRELPSLQYHQPELGWQVFQLAIQDADEKLWCESERCLYSGHHKQYERIASHLDYVRNTFNGEALEMWGRISALAQLSGHMSFEWLIDRLSQGQCLNGWKGAASIWAANVYTPQHGSVCWNGIRAALKSPYAQEQELLHELRRVFGKRERLSPVPKDVVDAYFDALEAIHIQQAFSLHEIDDWLGALVFNYPQEALDSAERVVLFLQRIKPPHLYLDELPQLLTRLFREAEEQELSDDGQMLKRVVDLQDSFLSLNLPHVETWLADAERP
jgi:hypothetical protein